jgi:hypothetical protein
MKQRANRPTRETRVRALAAEQPHKESQFMGMPCPCAPTPARVLFVFVAVIFGVWLVHAVERFRSADASLHLLKPLGAVAKPRSMGELQMENHMLKARAEAMQQRLDKHEEAAATAAAAAGGASSSSSASGAV